MLNQTMLDSANTFSDPVLVNGQKKEKDTEDASTAEEHNEQRSIRV